MTTNITVFGHFPVAVACSCPGPEHADDCGLEESKYEAADAALKEGVSVSYDDFVEMGGDR